MIKQAHLNAFIHSTLDSVLWYILKIHYQYGEISSWYHVNKNHADSAGFMTSADNSNLFMWRVQDQSWSKRKRSLTTKK